MHVLLFKRKRDRAAVRIGGGWIHRLSGAEIKARPAVLGLYPRGVEFPAQTEVQRQIPCDLPVVQDEGLYAPTEHADPIEPTGNARAGWDAHQHLGQSAVGACGASLRGEGPAEGEIAVEVRISELMPREFP